MHSNNKSVRSVIISILYIFLTFFILLTGGCSIFSPSPARPDAVVTVTSTVTETVVRTVIPDGVSPSAAAVPSLLSTSIKPPGEDYSSSGYVKDLSSNPARNEIVSLLKKGYLTVYSDGSFRPDEPVKRGVYLLWLYNASGRKTPLAVRRGSRDFSDIGYDHWLFGISEGISRAGGFRGLPDRSFRPEKNLTREEWCVMNCFFAADPQHVIEAVDTFPDHFKLAKYRDFKKIDKSNQHFVEYACSAGWCEKTFGRPFRRIDFEPSRPVTRAQAARWIYNYEESLGAY